MNRDVHSDLLADGGFCRRGARRSIGGFAAAIVAVAVFIAAGCGGQAPTTGTATATDAAGSARPAGARMQVQPIAVEVATIQTGTIPRVLRTSGRLKARSQVKITAGVAGQLLAVNVQVGDEVKPGDVLAVFDVETFDYDLRDAEISVLQARQDAARSGLALEKTEHDLQRALRTIEGERYDERIFSREAIENLQHAVALAKLDFDSAKQRAERAEVAVARARQARSECVIATPIRGVVVRRQAEPYDRVLRGAELFEVADPYSLELDVELTEAEAADVLPGQSALVAGRGRMSFVYPATVERVAPSVSVDRGLVAVNIRISPWKALQAVSAWGQTQQVMRLISGPVPGMMPTFPFAGSGTTPPLRPGTFVGVEIATAVHEHAILCPKEALQYERDTPYVFVAQPNQTVHRVAVTLRPEFATQESIEVVAGLAVGDQVVVRQADLKHGSPIRIANATITAADATDTPSAR